MDIPGTLKTASDFVEEHGDTRLADALRAAAKDYARFVAFLDGHVLGATQAFAVASEGNPVVLSIDRTMPDGRPYFRYRDHDTPTSLLGIPLFTKEASPSPPDPVTRTMGGFRFAVTPPRPSRRERRGKRR